MNKPWKIPVSVLVVIHTPDLRILLLERADHPGWWQSVTGSQNSGETLVETVAREVREETGLEVAKHRLTDWNQRNIYEIYECYRHRYAPGTSHNTEHVFSGNSGRPARDPGPGRAPCLAMAAVGSRRRTVLLAEQCRGHPPARGRNRACPGDRVRGKKLKLVDEYADIARSNDLLP